MPHCATKQIPCAFNLQKAGAHKQNTRNMQVTHEKHASDMQETCKKHASISSCQLHSTGTFLPFSYGIVALYINTLQMNFHLLILRRKLPLLNYLTAQLHLPQADTTTNFYPFPNKNSLCLGHWYWTGGVSKSLQCIKDLVNIVRHTDFDPSNICETKWDKINKALGENVREGGEGEWADVDAGWKTTLIKIEVLFHKHMETTGVKEYMAANLHYHSLVDIVKEHITDPHSGSTFHMEPYKLLWWPSEDHPEIRLHSELYTSDMFIEEYQALQDSPREPGCNILCIVVRCMVYSDSTHLTAFGDSHLWPCYFHFGNDTRYCRCIPLCNLCNHVAYFETVSLSMAYLAWKADFFC